MVKVELKDVTLEMIIAGLYCSSHSIEPMAIPKDVWESIAKKIEFFLDGWDYSKISLEAFIENQIFIYPKSLLDEEDIEQMKNTTLYWEKPNGNLVLSISMNIKEL